MRGVRRRRGEPGFCSCWQLCSIERKIFRDTPESSDSERLIRNVEKPHAFGRSSTEGGGNGSPLACRRGGFTVVESLVAIVVGLLSMVVFYMSASQAIQLVRSGKQMATASQLVQRRIETIRLTASWPDITTKAGLQALIATDAAEVAADSAAKLVTLPGVTETYTVKPYPAQGNTAFSLTWSPSRIRTEGVDLSSERCVQVTLILSWTGFSKTQRSCELATIITRGGV